MVFNWFRRQFAPSETSLEKTPSQSPQVEKEQEVPQQLEQTTESASTSKQSPAVDNDYLSWAKTAYKNIQKQQQPVSTQTRQQEDGATQTETADASETLPEEAQTKTSVALQGDTSEIKEIEDTIEHIGTTLTTSTTATTTVEEKAKATPETPEIAKAAIPATEFSETSVEVTNAVAAESKVVEPAITSAQTSADEVIAPKTTLKSTQPQEIKEAEQPTTPLPVWARQTERQERLKRLEANAIETSEPVTAAVEAQEAADVAFDEEFLWSAEVLAAQGRSPEDVSAGEISWLKQLRQGLGKTRRGLVNQLKAVVGQGPLNQDAVSEVEALLLQADVGVEATDYIIETLQAKLRQEALPPEQAIAYLKQILRDLLDQPYHQSYEPTFVPEKDNFNIWMMTGVNGAGKTTTIGKIAHMAKQSGYSCLIGAADTFRAAAVEQVKIWGERSGTEVIANPGKNTDPAAVVFDAITAAKSRDVELLLVDTAGRLQNKKNLMEELSKIRRIIDKKAPDAKVESLLVLDATLGQNGLLQAQVFSEVAKLSGVVLTKLDGSAKGGIALAVVQQLGLPIRFIGAGEGIEDLRPFSSYEFVEALLSG
ncbi:MAG: signal recognition particle-docking protein FtsY [Merismopedia sp. SIO2A8]|nr:signal recognition particle-docking protein FtsY [Symploca sp. SIO2B6]NET50552.1 signal recognition particle-docking protein FtsY [Merismopedia sp. SIO2A8]